MFDVSAIYKTKMLNLRFGISFFFLLCELSAEDSKYRKAKCTKNGFGCIFPFTYQNETYHECVYGDDGYWCGIVANVIEKDLDTNNNYADHCEPCDERVKLWKCSKEPKFRCSFPFEYQGREYSLCAPPNKKHGRNDAWCLVSENPNDWKYCSNNCETGYSKEPKVTKPPMTTTTTRSAITTTIFSFTLGRATSHSTTTDAYNTTSSAATRNTTGLSSYSREKAGLAVVLSVFVMFACVFAFYVALKCFRKRARFRRNDLISSVPLTPRHRDYKNVA